MQPRVTNEPAQVNEVQVKACWTGLLGNSATIRLLLSALPHFRMILCMKAKWSSCDLGENMYMLRVTHEEAKRILEYEITCCAYL